MVSVPSTELFDAQVCPKYGSVVRSDQRWQQRGAAWYVGLDGAVIGIDQSVALCSSQEQEFWKEYGFTVEHIAEVVKNA